mgnify:CR=1 FL=1
MLSLIKRTSRKNIVLLTCAVLVTILAYIAGYLTSVSSATEAEPQVIKIVSSSGEEKNIYNGSSLTLTEMYDSLMAAEGKEVDHRLIVYLLSIKQNENAMLRKMSEKSSNETLKRYADVQLEQNETVTETLFSWHKQWGFTHH